ncbi:MAG: thioredoxin domain-containing protein [Gemmataceae bacterium]|nr:thioredoxin domain-containing protein [Gemmataceae bacterium]MDW8265746.1 thioredoxin domain-containing protein [Gemmataceae bacterium]
MTTAAAPTNRLARESSPYLRQHATNPVDWYPWGPEALQKAKELDRPIFLSIGYSACHWCHVMEHESFQDPEIADILNRHFVSIKVDREERPDLDHIYMTAVQLLTGQGGWPMSVFLTPDLQPFFGGTYFPPDDRYGRPGFKRLLLAVAEAWQTRREALVGQAEEITRHLRQSDRVPTATGRLDEQLLRQAVAQLRRVYDPVHGGFGAAPKFPHPIDLRLLLRTAVRFRDDESLGMARHTLDRMAHGGIYDHLGGGFHRYSTDAQWLVPHFEKMLYDNALLSLVYLEAYQLTREPFYRGIVEETLNYVLREMTSPEGPFYSSQDADSEGVEGKFFVWSAAEIERVLGKEVAETFNYVYEVSEEGNWEGRNILHRTKTDAQCARLLGLSEAELTARLAEARRRLLEVRSQRVWPGRDEKILTSWNALMIASLASAGAALDDPQYTSAAVRAAEFILERMRTSDGRLLRTWSAGSEPKLDAYLEDYAFLIDALVSLYEATLSPRWVAEAIKLAETMLADFSDAGEAGLFYTSSRHESLLMRSKEFIDGSIPSSNAMAATGLLRLGALTGRTDLRRRAEAILEAASGLMDRSALAAGQFLVALDFLLGPVRELAVVGDLADAETQRVLRAIRTRFLPNKLVAFRSRSEPEPTWTPLLQGKPAADTVMTYICQDFTCAAPLAGPEALEKALEKG